MADAANALSKYSACVKRLKDHQEDNSGVFKDHERLMLAVVDAENDLRDAVAELGAGVSNSEHRVVVTPQTQNYADIDVIDSLVSNGSISKELRDTIVKTVQRPPRITISEVK